MNRISQVRINQGRIVPWQFRLAGSVLVIMLIFGSFLNFGQLTAIFISIALSYLLVPLWSSYYLLIIDPVRKEIAEIAWIAGFKRGDVTRYQTIEKIYINPIRTSQRITSYSGHVNEFKANEFAAYLKINSGQTFELMTDKSIDKLLNKMTPIVEKLGMELVRNDLRNSGEVAQS